MDHPSHSIRDVAKACQESLSRLLEAVQDETCPVRNTLRDSDVERMLERFEQWSGNLGALQPSESSLSLQHRLRDSLAVRSAMLKTLHDLRDSIASALEIASGTRHNRMADPVSNQDVDLAEYDISSSDSDSLTSGSSKLQNRQDSATTSEIIELLTSIKLGINNLFKASVFIRKFAPKDKRQRASKTEPFDNRADVLYVKDKYGHLARHNEALALRLGEANARRRQYFTYRRDHNEQLSEVKTKPEVKETQSMDILPLIRSQAGGRLSELGKSAVSGCTKPSVGATTEATAFVSDETQTQLGVILEAEPSIFKPVNKEHQWHKHVLEDLEPYICTFPGCGLETYKSQRAWFEHELLLHRNVWLCPECSYQFDTADLLESHINNDHRNQVPDKQISAIVEASRRPVQHINPKDCAFCGKDWATVEGPITDPAATVAVDTDQFRRHLGQHLQQIALFSLPRSHMNQEAGSKEAGGVLDQDILSIGPRWIRDDCGKGWTIIAGKRSLFIALAAFQKCFDNVKSSLSETTKEYRFARTGDISDLEEAIGVAREAVDATPQDHPDRAGRLNNLGVRLGNRYSRTGAMAKRFALLIGIDLYLNDGSRKSKVDNLQGCVNDVKVIREFLRNEFQLHKLCILTSSPSSANPTIPEELDDCLPTFKNIKGEFDNVYEQACPGDLFFFHFSGHGAELQRTNNSPAGRLNDASLLTMDYCCGKPAVRGWQLNEWLKKLNEKKIYVVVSLDSCHAAGSWRNDGSFRTPKDWTPPPNLPIDEAVVQETFSEPNNRYGELDVSWDINLDDFTLMAACESIEYAAEKTVNGITYGAFTYALCAYFQRNQPGAMFSTYRTIRDHIARDISPQNPRVYGRDRLVFFGNKELFSVTPVLAEINGDVAFLPIGKVHGVKIRAEFTIRSPTSEVTLSISEVDDFESKAYIARDPSLVLPQHIEVIPFRWSSEETLKVLVESSLPRRFQKELSNGLQKRIVGDIEVIEFGEHHGFEAGGFRLKRRGDDGIDISGPVSLMGYEGPVRGLEIKAQNENEQATKSAVALTHLFRFEQILNLRNQAPRDTAPFKVTLDPESGPDGTPLSEGSKITFTFKNDDEAELHFTVINLGPGFHVKQLFPSEDSPKTVPRGEIRSFFFRLTIPNKLKHNKADYQKHPYRDIIRTVVTRNKKLSFKSLELPDIWNADQVESGRRSGSGRDTELLFELNFSWWIQDNVIQQA
ncbi:hypothetical protein DL765_009836 [Monosporascus sp. GIB2]|nr:hypothetical protein DL765_009836 [Monosporascus sp. GIB2]